MDLIILLGTVAGFQIAAAASPGPNFFLVSNYATTKSVRHALDAIVGIIFGILIWSTLAVVGLGALISSSPTAYAIVQYLGACYLIWLGAQMVYSTFCSASSSESEEGKLGNEKPALKGFLVNIGNPKTIAYYTSLFAVLVPSNATGWVLCAVVATDAIACAGWWVFVAFLFGSNPVKRAFLSIRKQVERFFGGALIFLGLALAMDRS